MGILSGWMKARVGVRRVGGTKKGGDGTFGGFEVGGFGLMKKRGCRGWCRWVGGLWSVEMDLRVVSVFFQRFTERE